jgi:hypothetical protein
MRYFSRASLRSIGSAIQLLLGVLTRTDGERALEESGVDSA